MSKNTHKHIYNKLFLAVPIALFFGVFAQAQRADALSFTLPSIFKFGSDTKTIDNGKIENLQSLKVFETNKVISVTDINLKAPKLLASEDADSFEVEDNVLIDNLDENHAHADNAVYTVQKGDSIYSIASYFGVTVSTITSYNRMTSKEVHPGDVLEVPSVAGVMYTIKKGDTLDKIARKYAVDVDDVSLYNGLLGGEKLTIGDEIFLPGAKETEATVKKVTQNLAKSTTKILRGDTAHLNTSGDIKKYSGLPKYPGYYILPTPGAVRTQKMHGHNGVDFGNKIGAPVYASADGVVRVAKSSGYNFGYGKYIIVTHSNGSETIYAHLSQVNVSPGQSVGQGTTIGAVGSTGNSTGPHLHFEIRGAYNPFAW